MEQFMRRYFPIVLLILLFFLPYNSLAGSKTKSQVLTYLTSLKLQPNKKVLSGQHTGWLNDGNNGHDMYGNDLFGYIFTKSGGYTPAIMGADIDYFNGNGPYDLSRLINHWNNGGLIELSWIAANPTNNQWTWPLNPPSVNLPDVYTPGNMIYNNFHAHMDIVAGALQTLQANGVVVLFRPLLEMNGGNDQYPSWNWWGGKDTFQFKTLWQYVHNYFTNVKGLNNIIWVYSVQNYWRKELDYYPGSNFVDVVGYDYYPLGWDGNYDRFPYVEEYDTLRFLGKPIALTELGQCPADADWNSCINKDTRYIINDIKSNMPDVVYWMNWDDQWELGLNNYLPQLFADPWVVNRSDNPSGITPGQNKVPSSPTGLSIH